MATRSQAIVQISGTERTVEAWLRDPALPNLERLMAAVTTPRAPTCDLDGLRLPVIDFAIGLSDVSSDTLDAVEREARWRATSAADAKAKRIYPGRYRRFRLEASYLARITGAGALEIQQYLGLQDELEWRGKQGAPDRPRSRSLDRVITQGDRDWARLGVWPYALYGDSRLPHDWRHRRETADALNEYVIRIRQNY